MHDSTFPDSPEDPNKRTDRAVEALRYEERAGLGFRRRDRNPIGNPYAGDDPERYQVDRPATAGQLWAGYIGGIGIVLALTSIVYKPLIFGLFAVFFCVAAVISDGPAAKIGRIGVVVTAISVALGMLFAIFVTESPIF